LYIYICPPFVHMCVDGIHRGATIYAIPSHLKPRNREKNLKSCTNSSGLTHFEVTALEANSGSLHGINFASSLEAVPVIKFQSLTSENNNWRYFLLRKNITNSLVARAKRGSTTYDCYLWVSPTKAKKKKGSGTSIRVRLQRQKRKKGQGLVSESDYA